MRTFQKVRGHKSKNIMQRQFEANYTCNMAKSHTRLFVHSSIYLNIHVPSIHFLIGVLTDQMRLASRSAGSYGRCSLYT